MSGSNITLLSEAVSESDEGEEGIGKWEIVGIRGNACKASTSPLLHPHSTFDECVGKQEDRVAGAVDGSWALRKLVEMKHDWVF